MARSWNDGRVFARRQSCPAVFGDLSRVDPDRSVVRDRQQHPWRPETGVHPHQLPGRPHWRGGTLGHGDLAPRARADARGIRAEERRSFRLCRAPHRHHVDDRRGHPGRIVFGVLGADDWRRDAGRRQRHDRSGRQSTRRRPLPRGEDDASEPVPCLLPDRNRCRRPRGVRAGDLWWPLRLLAVSARRHLHPDPRVRHAGAAAALPEDRERRGRARCSATRSPARCSCCCWR